MRRHGVRRAEHGVISVAARAAEAVAVAAVRGVFGARDHIATHTVVGGVAVGVARAQVHVAAHAAKQTQLHVSQMPSGTRECGATAYAAQSTASSAPRHGLL